MLSRKIFKDISMSGKVGLYWAMHNGYGSIKPYHTTVYFVVTYTEEEDHFAWKSRMGKTGELGYQNFNWLAEFFLHTYLYHSFNVYVKKTIDIEIQCNVIIAKFWL